MELDQFLSQILSQSIHTHKYQVVIFKGQVFPALFFSKIVHKILKPRYAVSSINSNEIDMQHIKAQLSLQPLFSDTVWHWLGDLGALPIKKREELLAYCDAYTGPHTLCYFAESNKNTEHLIVTIPNTINKELFIALYAHFFSPDHPQQKIHIITNVFEQYSTLSLDAACMLMEYITVISKAQSQEFVRYWLPAIINSEPSLFLLSTHFFAKKPGQFFGLWSDIAGRYPIQFWISYWSEQLFRAANFVQLARANNFSDARKIAYKLPFNFIKKDWLHYSSKDLVAAHHRLSILDYHVKNGGSENNLDLWYAQFFQTMRS
jgi:predicted SnoaL-like aldol condensation-catalyzing enzyme